MQIVISVGVIPMDYMVTMSVRLPKQVVTWLRKRAALETIEKDERVSMNGLIVEILTQTMEADRRMMTRFVGSAKSLKTDSVD
jgi:hypothetical protein